MAYSNLSCHSFHSIRSPA